MHLAPLTPPPPAHPRTDRLLVRDRLHRVDPASTFSPSTVSDLYRTSRGHGGQIPSIDREQDDQHGGDLGMQRAPSSVSLMIAQLNGMPISLRAVHIGSTDVAVANAPDMVNVDENSVPYLDKVHCTCSPCRDMVSVLFSQCGCVVFYLHFGEIRGKPLPPSHCCPLCRSHAKIYATSRSPQADLSLQLDGAPSSMHVRCF